MKYCITSNGRKMVVHSFLQRVYLARLRRVSTSLNGRNDTTKNVLFWEAQHSSFFLYFIYLAYLNKLHNRLHLNRSDNAFSTYAAIW